MYHSLKMAVVYLHVVFAYLYTIFLVLKVQGLSQVTSDKEVYAGEQHQGEGQASPCLLKCK